MKITWFGHSAFRLDLGSNVILIDPFFTGNPAFIGDRDAAISGVTHICLTHGHSDHVGDTVFIAKETGAKVIANYELCLWLASQGIEQIDPMNFGGTVSQDGFKISLVRAEHSSSDQDIPLGSAGGIIITAEGHPTVYHMGDTDIFGDMALIHEIYTPHIGLVPIGDRFTMSPKIAAIAVKRFFQFSHVFPCHYGSFPMLEQTPDHFLEAMQGHATQVILPEKGVAVDFSK